MWVAGAFMPRSRTRKQSVVALATNERSLPRFQSSLSDNDIRATTLPALKGRPKVTRRDAAEIQHHWPTPAASAFSSNISV